MMADFDFTPRLTAWAARKLDVPRDQVVSVDTDSWGLCDTCDHSGGEITVRLADGRVFAGEAQWGLMLADILDMDLDDDGNVKPRGEDPFPLTERGADDGQACATDRLPGP
jgi:hypothetical protein